MGAGITGRIGTVDRFGQGRQLTMDGRPLYTFSGEGPGQLRGNGVGNLWWAMTPTGLAATANPSDKSTFGPPRSTTLTVVHTRFGPVVANSRGQVLYDYTDDTTTRRMPGSVVSGGLAAPPGPGHADGGVGHHRERHGDQWLRRCVAGGVRCSSPLYVRGRSAPGRHDRPGDRVRLVSGFS